MIFISGATGSLGRIIVDLAKQAGVNYRALVHTPMTLDPGAPVNLAKDIAVANLEQPTTLERTMRDVERALLLSPVTPNQRELEENFITAAKSAGVKHVVKISQVGADARSNALLARAHGEAERVLEDSGLAFTHLRPNFTNQNFLWFAAEKKMDTAAGNARVSFVDARDVAAVAVAALTQPGHEGRTYTLTGPETITFAEAAAKLSAATGDQYTYHDIPPADYPDILRPAMPEWFIQSLTEIYASIRNGEAEPVTDDTPRVLGRAATTFDQFAQDYASVFNAVVRVN